MDVDDLITYFFLFLFFVLPSILKRKGKGKKTAKKAEQKLEAKAKAVKKKKSNLFDRLGEAIREAVRELENQAKEAKRKQQQEGQGKEKDSVWDLFDDRRADAEAPPARARKADVPEPMAPASDEEAATEARPGWPTSDPQPRSFDPDHPFAAPRKTPPKPERRARDITPSLRKPPAPLPVQAALPSHALQQAVVWSEILGKPKALRD